MSRINLTNRPKNEGDEFTHNEFNSIVEVIDDIDATAVRSISLNNATPMLPDANGNVNITMALGDYEQILTVKYNGQVLTGTPHILSADGDVTLQVQYKESTITQNGDDVIYTPTGQLVTLTVTSVMGGAQTELLSRQMMSASHDSTAFIDVPLSRYLQNGEQDIQLRITNTINANPAQVLIKVTKANLSLSVESEAAWYTDAKIVTSDLLTHSITAQYIVLGAVTNKTLHVLFKGESGDETREVENIATDDPQLRISVTYNETSTSNIGFFSTNGVREIEAWVTCTIDGQTVESNHIKNNIIVVADPSTAEPMIAVQEIVTVMTNYESMKIFSWNMYNPLLSGSRTSKVTFLLANQDKTITFLSAPYENISNNTSEEFSQNISISSSGSLIDVYVYADVDGDDVNGGESIAFFQVDNSVDYAAIPNPDFYLNPALRQNTETDPERIINASDGSEISGVTFSGMSWRDGLDGWTPDVVNANGTAAMDSKRVLRVAAGGQIAIPYNAYSEFSGSSNRSHYLTIELDFAVRNVTNENDPVFTIGNADGTSPRGVFLKPLNGGFFSAPMSNSWSSADVSWQEGVRTHLVFNIQENYTVQNPDTTRSPQQTATMNVIRTYINGVINREYTFTDKSQIAAGGSIIIGQSGCDIDIYNLRIYKDTEGKSNLSPNDVIKNYISTLPTGAERLEVKTKNDILTQGKISLAKCVAHGYNCIVWHGGPVNKGNTGKKYGYADIYRFNADGTEDVEHTGTLYGIVMKGQGTTAMGYAEWNIQFQDAKDAAEDSSLSPNNKREFISKSGTATGKFGYRLETGDPLAKKLVGKINYASSMQSHKMGACNLYNDLYRRLVTDTITNFSDGKRVTVKEEPFLYFVQRTESDHDEDKVFQGLMTFGPGKADKPTWGVSDDDLMAGDCILEGSLNNNPLTDARVPFVESISYSTNNEAFMYAGEKNLNFDYGDTADLHDGADAWPRVDEINPGAEIPTISQVKLWQPIWNFLYLTNVGIKPWTGTLAELNAAAANNEVDTSYAYWMNSAGTGYSRFDLFRCHYVKEGTAVSKTFVPAGIRLIQGTKTYLNFNTLYALTAEDENTRPTAYSSTDLWYDTDVSNQRTLTLNLRTALQDFLGITISVTGVSSASLNNTFMLNLGKIFTLYADSNLYVNKNSVLFHHEFMKLVAGTDNRSKNTYYRLNPYANPIKDEHNVVIGYRPNMEMNDDDLDTIFKTNNAGIQSKPYYILEHDTDEQGSTYWDGQMNALNNTLEVAYGYALDAGDKHYELCNMMKSMFTEMTAMSSTTGVTGSPQKCIEDYFMYIQKYFPAVAYNETARIRYEVPSLFYMNESPTQVPLTQSLGDQYDSEKEYIKRRIIMLTGYAGYSNSVTTLDFRGYNGIYVANIKPHYWIYPMSKISGGGTFSPDMTNTRVPAGDTYPLSIGTNEYKLSIVIFFLNELTELGNMASWGGGDLDNSATPALPVTSERLTKIECYSATEGGVLFQMPMFDIHASKNIEEINFLNDNYLTGFRDGITGLMRLRKIDLRGTGVTSLLLPQTTNLREVRLPAGFQELIISYAPELETLTLDGFASLRKISIRNAPKVDTKDIIMGAYNATALAGETILQELKIYNVNWTGVSADFMEFLVSIPDVILTGTITMNNTTGGDISFALKKKIIDKFGDVDHGTEGLTLIYTRRAITSFTINGEGWFTAAGQTKSYVLFANDDSRNNITAHHWYIDEAHTNYAQVDEDTGDVTCLLVSETAAGGPVGTLTCVITLSDGSELTATLDIRFFDRPAEVGDFVYHDGTYDNRLIRNKTVIGICFWSKGSDRRMVALRRYGQSRFGLYPSGGFDSGLTFTDPADNTSKGVYDMHPTGSTVSSNNYNTTTMTTWADEEINGTTYNAPSQAAYVFYSNMVDSNGKFIAYGSGSAGTNGKVTISQTLISECELTEADGWSGGMSVPIGQQETLRWISWRNRVLRGTNWTYDDDNEGRVTVNGARFIPDEPTYAKLSASSTAIQDFAQNKLGVRDNYSNYALYLYYPASRCFAYQPAMDSSSHVLDSRFKSTHWYLPSAYELYRIFFYNTLGNPSSPLYVPNRAVPDIFKPAIDAVKMTRYTDGWLYSSTEAANGNEVHVLNLETGRRTTAPKINSYYFWPCCTF